MAKKESTGTAVRNKKPRTAAQKAADTLRKQKNVKLAADRLAALQAKQKADIEAKQAAAVAKHQHDNEDEYVASALAGTFGMILDKWLAGREATFDRVNRFFTERPQLWAALPQDIGQRQEAERAMDNVQPHRRRAA